MSSLRSIVIAVDSSPLAEYAFDWAMERIVDKEKDEVIVLHIQEFEKPSSAYFAGVSAESIVPNSSMFSSEEVQPEALVVLGHYIELCKQRNLKHFKYDVITKPGNAGAAICGYIDQLIRKEHVGGEDISKQFTLVLGSRELGFFSRAFLGSTSQYCTNNCPCPVIVVKKHADEVPKARPIGEQQLFEAEETILQ
eukprot:TRINITY_DN2728_c0_g1_i1.p1 TRINITY_DN2728_c0_g1~~TRINITY_DN2728_c0_g1_i1.p1  ORF type:complete len:195 (-),score=55.27 TRINITY_DN2728_c0_g1_i1:97-681(-)